MHNLTTHSYTQNNVIIVCMYVCLQAKQLSQLITQTDRRRNRQSEMRHTQIQVWNRSPAFVCARVLVKINIFLFIHVHEDTMSLHPSSPSGPMSTSPLCMMSPMFYTNLVQERSVPGTDILSPSKWKWYVLGHCSPVWLFLNLNIVWLWRLVVSCHGYHVPAAIGDRVHFLYQVCEGLRLRHTYTLQQTEWDISLSVSVFLPVCHPPCLSISLFVCLSAPLSFTLFLSLCL